jgi:glycosyltransferase involved in cell wall biosynthesis
VGFVGRLSRGKGVGYFIDYAIRTLREAPDFIFFIIGSGKETTGWQATIRQAGFEEKIIFLGEKKNIQNYYPQLDLLLFTSDPQAEGMPGLPILARRSKTLEEVQDYYPRIRFINTGLSPRENIEKALSMPKVSTAPLVEEFSIETMKHRTHQLYQSLLQS